MAINIQADIRCQNGRHPLDQRPTADGFVYTQDRDGRWWWEPLCENPCIEELKADPDPYPHPVAYLDPTRQRRPHAYLDGCTEPNHYCTNPDHIPALPHGHDRHPT